MKPIGRARRITGIVFVVIGALLVARVGWLAAFYGSYFGNNEWIRFWGLLWIGIALALLGSWLMEEGEVQRRGKEKVKKVRPA